MPGASRGDQRTTGAERADTASDATPPRVVVSGDETGGRFALLETLTRRGAEPPLHLHSREDELVYVLAGRVTFCQGDQDLRCGPGDGVLLPRGCEHSYRVESGEGHCQLNPRLWQGGGRRRGRRYGERAAVSG